MTPEALSTLIASVAVFACLTHLFKALRAREIQKDIFMSIAYDGLVTQMREHGNAW